MTLLAKLIAKEEGFFRSGTLPARDHNPGDLRHSPHSEHPLDPNAIGEIDTDDHGWEDLERQLRIDAARGLTLGAAIFEWAPASDGNNPSQYLNDIVSGFAAAGIRVVPTQSLDSVLTFEA